MKRFLLSLIAIVFVAASCNLNEPTVVKYGYVITDNEIPISYSTTMTITPIKDTSETNEVSETNESSTTNEYIDNWICGYEEYYFYMLKTDEGTPAYYGLCDENGYSYDVGSSNFNYYQKYVRIEGTEVESRNGYLLYIKTIEEISAPTPVQPEPEEPISLIDYYATTE